MSAVAFDYESKVWGAPEVRLSPRYIQALKLRYCLDDLAGVSGRVLDIGCGGGNMPRAIQRYRPDLQVWGVDVSRTALRSAGGERERARFAAAGGTSLPFPAGFFSAVTMFDVLEHIAEPGEALEEVRRVLSPAGLFHLFLPLEKQPWTIYAVLNRLGWKGKEVYCGHVRAYTDGEAREALEMAGFDVQNLRWSFHPVFAMVDVAYFCFLSLRGRPVSTSVEGFIHGDGHPPARRVVGALKDLLVAAGYWESRLLRWLPGGGGHFTAVNSPKEFRSPP